MNGNNLGSLGVLVLALMVVGFMGAFALIYPNSAQTPIIVGALVLLAGGAGGYFFHERQQAFLGTSLHEQRVAFVSALQATAAGVNGMTPSAPSGNPGSAAGTPSANSPTTPKAASDPSVPAISTQEIPPCLT